MPDTHQVSDFNPQPALQPAPDSALHVSVIEDRRSPRRTVIGVLIAILTVLVLAAVAVALLDRGHPAATGWAALPDPLTVNQDITAARDGSRGQTLAVGGGQGNGTITPMTGQKFPASILADITCQGTGDLTITGVGGAGCYDEGMTAYEITAPTGPATNTLTITAPPGLRWRITISTYTL